MTTTNSTTSSRTEVHDALTIFEVAPGVQFTLPILRMLLPDIETTLFFAKVYDLTAAQLGHLLGAVHNTTLVQALTCGSHSTSLQDYLLDPGWLPAEVTKGQVSFDKSVPTGEVLPELWKSLEVQVAQSIKDVATKLKNVVGMLPGKQGSMVFSSMMKMNVKRPTLGDYRAKIHHAPIKDNLVIMDVSGSMSEATVKEIVGDVVALSYMANAHLAVVSNTTTHWEPGTYNVDTVLAASEFGGTHYETLAPLLDRDWGTVVSIADYDSSQSAYVHLRRVSNGHIDEVLDVSLVNQPTFLAECLGIFADTVRPILVANTHSVLGSGW